MSGKGMVASVYGLKLMVRCSELISGVLDPGNLSTLLFTLTLFVAVSV